MSPSRAALLLALVPAGASAQDIVVTGRGLAAPVGDRALDTVTIDRDRLAAAGSLEDALGDVAGLQQYRRSDARSAHPTSQGVTLRGLGGNAASRALLILDGVPQADPFGGWVAFPAYGVERLGGVRVTRGGGSGFWGPGALAGTIELESAGAADVDRLTAAADYGSRDSLDLRGSAALVRTGGFATVAGGYARGDGFVPIRPADQGPADVPARYRNANGAVRGVIAVAPDTEFQATVQAFTDRRTRGYAFSDNASDGADASVRLVGSGRWRWSALGYLQTREFASRFASVNAARTTVTPTLDQYNVPATGYGGRVEVEPPIGAGATLRLGGDVRAVEGTTNEFYTYVAGVATRRREAGGRTQTFGAFADLGLPLGAVTVDLGGRLDHWRIADGRLIERPLAGGAALTNLAYPVRTGWEPTGRAGLAWTAAEAISLRTAAYRGWRLPTLNELYRPFRVGADATAANPDLAPERLDGAEAGVDLRPARGLRLAATAFASRLDGAIANVTAGQGPGTFPGVGVVAAGGVYRVRQNLRAVTATGFELDASADIGSFAAQLSYSGTRARVEGTGASAGLDGLHPAQTPAHQASATLGWSHGPAALSLTGRYVSAQFDDDANTRPLHGAFTLDGHAALPLGAALAVEGRAENLFDAEVPAGFSGAALERATPRTLWIGLRYRLR